MGDRRAGPDMQCDRYRLITVAEAVRLDDSLAGSIQRHCRAVSATPPRPLLSTASS